MGSNYVWLQKKTFREDSKEKIKIGGILLALFSTNSSGDPKATYLYYILIR